MFFDIFISMLTGLYSGLIASKYIRYVHIKAHAIQLVKHAEHLHGHEEKKIAMLRTRDIDHLESLADDLTGLGYRVTANLIREIEQVLRQVDNHSLTEEDMCRQVDDWIEKIRGHNPALLPTLMAWRI